MAPHQFHQVLGLIDEVAGTHASESVEDRQRRLTASAQRKGRRHNGTAHRSRAEAAEVCRRSRRDATWSQLPERPPADLVGRWRFTPGPARAVGGVHSKSFHTAPDGSVWMFKPDESAGGALAHAEAAASEILARSGVPSVPVYVRAIGGRVGSIQPLLGGASHLSSNPSSWSQADIDAIVRYHVAAWAVGDHDGKPDNLLRTAGGGLVPVDQGQAFKFFGRDQLATSYHPNGSSGAARPVYHQAYRAARAGRLAPGVRIHPQAALPIIEALEAMPVWEYRAVLHATAHHGAARPGVHWVTPMCLRAAARLGSPHVPPAAIAEEFLDYAMARKNSLRRAFAAFFATEGLHGAREISAVG
jgi:hypothetical protein